MSQSTPARACCTTAAGWCAPEGKSQRLATPSGGQLTTPAGVASNRSTRDTDGKDATDDPSAITEQSAQTLTPTVLGANLPPRE